MTTVTEKTTRNGDSPTESHLLTADAIIKAKDLKEEVVEVEEWGGNVLIRSFTKKGQQEVRQMSMVDDEVDPERLEMYMFLRGVVEPHFTDDQYEQLREKAAGPIDMILNRIMEISGMSAEAQAKAKRKFPVTP